MDSTVTCEDGVWRGNTMSGTTPTTFEALKAYYTCIPTGNLLKLERASKLTILRQIQYSLDCVPIIADDDACGTTSCDKELLNPTDHSSCQDGHTLYVVSYFSSKSKALVKCNLFRRRMESRQSRYKDRLLARTECGKENQSELVHSLE